MQSGLSTRRKEGVVCEAGVWRSRFALRFGYQEEGRKVCQAAVSPAMACTATRRKPRTSPFSLTTATLWIRGTGYRRLLRYTNALVTGEKHSQR